MFKRISGWVRGLRAQQTAQRQQAGLLRRDHDWQRVRPIDTVGENGEILGLEICIGCKAKRRTALHSNGRIQVIATEPDPLPPYCSERFDDLGKLYKRKTALGK